MIENPLKRKGKIKKIQFENKIIKLRIKD